MSLAAETPKLPKWIFLAGDAALFAVAAFVAKTAAHPAAGAPLAAIVTCVALGAVLGALPFVVDDSRRHEAALDERQKSLESLARTVATSAEQVGIATGGLHEIAASAHRNLHQAEQFSHQLQEKIAELQAQLAEAREGDREEAARLESAADKIARTAAEGVRLEAAVRKSFAAALAEFEARAAAWSARAESAAADLAARAEAGSAGLEARIAALERVERRPTRRPAPPALEAVPPPAAADSSVGAAAAEPAPDSNSASPAGEAPKPPAEGTAAAEEPSPILARQILEVRPVAGNTRIPHATFKTSAVPSPARPEGGGEPALAEVGAAPPPRSARTRKSAAALEAVLELGLDETVEPRSAEAGSSAAAADAAEPAISTDGATRLLVTAYIGIGNRLFIRGDGPGLAWDKGVPLQFVSIGKWRWETADAARPFTFRLYKNDEIECPHLGLRTIEPGRQHEFAAAF